MCNPAQTRVQPGPTPVDPDQPEIKPVKEKQGLSGGAIAGIVIGSVAGAAALGCGGFAIFWFVIKKKTWAEFIALFKKH